MFSFLFGWVGGIVSRTDVRTPLSACMEGIGIAPPDSARPPERPCPPCPGAPALCDATERLGDLRRSAHRHPAAVWVRFSQ